jgi:hypothetical protein
MIPERGIYQLKDYFDGITAIKLMFFCPGVISKISEVAPFLIVRERTEFF